MTKDLYAILVCPVAKCHLDYDEVKQELVSRPMGLVYPIRSGTPILLESEARRLKEN